MKTKKKILSACFAAALFTLVFIHVHTAYGCGCSCGDPLFYPRAVAGAVVNGAVTIATAPIEPFYYEYYHRVWIPGHFTLYGHWIPGYWRYYR